MSCLCSVLLWFPSLCSSQSLGLSLCNAHGLCWCQFRNKYCFPSLLCLLPRFSRCPLSCALCCRLSVTEQALPLFPWVLPPPPSARPPFFFLLFFLHYSHFFGKYNKSAVDKFSRKYKMNSPGTCLQFCLLSIKNFVRYKPDWMWLGLGLSKVFFLPASCFLSLMF